MKTTVLLLSLVVAMAQTRPATPPTRDNTTPPVGTATISGRVTVDDVGRQPLRKAVVALGSGGLQLPQITLTDDAGRYRFAGVAHGSYTIGVVRSPYIPAFYGSKRAGKGPGIPIAVLDGQQVTGIDLRMLRGGAVTGVVRSPTGQPAPGVSVMVTQVQSVNGVRRMSSSVGALMALAGGPTETDDRGVYRAYGLPPGDYVVQTQMEQGTSSLSESRLVTAEEVQWAQQVTAQTSGGVVNPATASPPPAPGAGRTVAYAPVYYPGTTLASEAQLVTIGPGEERRGIDFSRQLVPTARLTGVVLDIDGRPLAGASVQLKASDADASDLASLILGNVAARTNADGAFTISAVRPGRYALTARGAPRQQGRQSSSPLDAILGGRAGELGNAPELGALMGILGATQPWWAREEIAVDGRDLADMTLRMQPGMAISGRIVFEGGAATPADLTKVRISFGPVPTSASPIELAMSSMTGGNLATTAADGTFAVKGVVPGRYRGAVGGGPAMMLAMLTGGAPQLNNWTLKSIVLGDRDIADVAFDVKPNEDVTGVVVTMTDRPTELSGTVFDQTGRATGNFPIVVFSTDRSYWAIGSRRVQQARPANDGTFKIGGLPAGEYFVCAVTDLDPEDLYDPAFLDQLMAAGGYRITLADGEKRGQDLKLAGGGF